MFDILELLEHSDAQTINGDIKQNSSYLLSDAQFFFGDHRMNTLDNFRLESVFGSTAKSRVAHWSLTVPDSKFPLSSAARSIFDAELGRREQLMIAMAISAASGDLIEAQSFGAKALEYGSDPRDLLAAVESVSAFVGAFRGSKLAEALVDIIRDCDEPLDAFSSRVVQLSDHETKAVDTGGEGAPIVLLHSLGTNHLMWRYVIRSLAATRRVVAYDMRGFGHAAGAPKPFSFEQLAADARDLIRTLDLGPVQYAGLSVGGTVALHLGLLHPECVSSLAVICATAIQQDAFAHRAEAAETLGLKAQVVPTLTRWFTTEALAANNWGVRYARNCVLKANIEDWAACWRALAAVNCFDRLGDIRVPTRFIAGEVDPSTPPSVMQQHADRVPGSEFFVVPNGPHMLSLEKGQELAQLLAQ
ncbi:alpha/beta fold hydrolase [Xanthobacter autotrophicus]|uniref:alpha/beta fold hydrolase n=1 Tax=Xanthobacter autotrophicus TaxID=280 RepID=UPI00372A21B4